MPSALYLDSKRFPHLPLSKLPLCPCRGHPALPESAAGHRRALCDIIWALPTAAYKSQSSQPRPPSVRHGCDGTGQEHEAAEQSPSIARVFIQR